MARRFYEHKNKLVTGFSSKYNLNKLVYVEVFENVEDALAREKQLKGWVRRKKDALVESLNPEWKDLSEGIL